MTLRTHFWTAALALVVIFAAGSGFAYLLTSAREKKESSENPPLETVASTSWVETTLDRLTESLDLKPDQVEMIRNDIESAGLEVADVRERAMLQYHLLLLRIHQDIAPKLDPEQKAKLEKSQKILQNTIEHRFPNKETVPLVNP